MNYLKITDTENVDWWLNLDGYAIAHIKKPTEAVKLAAVNQNGRAIQYIKNPSEAVVQYVESL